MSILERFIKYVKVDTMSSEESNTVPSTKKQFDLAYILVDELIELGLNDAFVNEHSIVMATLPTNSSKKDKTIGFIAHLDTIPGFSGTNCNPIIHKNWDGSDINLKNDINITLKQFPYMKSCIGNTLITTDGTTVLGADDKAGIADIMGMLEYFASHPEVEHTTIKVAFTPDEEIGGCMDLFDLDWFNSDFAYTIDGGAANTINYECFNAASAKVNIKGLDIHPGSAKGQMINASYIATLFEGYLPKHDKPMYTEGHEGFIHLTFINGETGYANMEYIIRDHDIDKLNEKKKLMLEVKDKLNQEFGEGVVSITFKDQYRNMYNIIKEHPECLDRVKDAMNNLGIKTVSDPIRGGTDGARLTERGLMTPNLGTGGGNCHGPYEYACLEEMQLISDILVEIAKIK